MVGKVISTTPETLRGGRVYPFFPLCPLLSTKAHDYSFHSCTALAPPVIFSRHRLRRSSTSGSFFSRRRGKAFSRRKSAIFHRCGFQILVIFLPVMELFLRGGQTFSSLFHYISISFIFWNSKATHAVWNKWNEIFIAQTMTKCIVHFRIASNPKNLLFIM